MDEQTDSLKSVKKLIPIVVAVILVVLFIKMHSMPPEGQWVNDAAAPVLPSLRHTHINEPWTKAFYSDNKLSAQDEAIQTVPGVPVDRGERHSYFSSPRILTARTSPGQSMSNNGNIDPNASAAAVPAVSPTNEPRVVVEDLLRPGYMKDSHNIYNSEFGTASDGVK